MPAIDRLFRAYATDKKIPGMVWGVVIDGRIAHVGSFGVRDRASKAPVTPDTAFRIASMTKSFTALAILKLRDDGRLSLEDPVAKLDSGVRADGAADARYAAADRPPAPQPQRRLPRRQPLGRSAAERHRRDDGRVAGARAFRSPRRRGRATSIPITPSVCWAGVVANASGVPYEDYVRTGDPGQAADGPASTFGSPTFPPRSRAVGYRLKPDGTYGEEPPLPHGVFGAMGGLLTTADGSGQVRRVPPLGVAASRR